MTDGQKEQLSAVITMLDKLEVHGMSNLNILLWSMQTIQQILSGEEVTETDG